MLWSAAGSPRARTFGIRRRDAPAAWTPDSMWVFYLFAAVVILQSLLSLRGGVRYFNFFRRELASPRTLYMPFATVFVPCRGLDQGLRWNLSALFRQHYPAYELLFVSDRADDPALELARQLADEFEG